MNSDNSIVHSEGGCYLSSFRWHCLRSSLAQAEILAAQTLLLEHKRMYENTSAAGTAVSEWSVDNCVCSWLFDAL